METVIVMERFAHKGLFEVERGRGERKRKMSGGGSVPSRFV